MDELDVEGGFARDWATSIRWPAIIPCNILIVCMLAVFFVIITSSSQEWVEEVLAAKVLQLLLARYRAEVCYSYR